MEVAIRPMTRADVETCGRICHAAFARIASDHNFRPDFPSPEVAIQLTQFLQANPQVFSIVAEADGEIIGANHLWEYDEIRAVGPITITPSWQSKGLGRRLMEAVIARAKGSKGIRLVQDTFNMRSLSLYASLGFEVKEPLAVIEGVVKGRVPSGIEIRVLEERDLAGCADLSRRSHGFERINELKNTPPFLTSFVAMRDGRVVAYASAPHFWALNHAIAECEDDLQALLTGVGNLSEGKPLSLLVPTRKTSLLRWFLQNKMQLIKPMGLMVMGEYDEPRTSYLPSVGY